MFCKIQTIVPCLYHCMCMSIVYMMLYGYDYQFQQYLLSQHLLCSETISVRVYPSYYIINYFSIHHLTQLYQSYMFKSILRNSTYTN